MALPWEISSDDIVAWATTNVGASAELPVLIRRLLAATVPLREIEMRSHGGTRLGGWDGTVTTRQGTPHCPTGRSRWELTVQNDLAKFNSDFEKRPASSDEAYVAITARRYSRKQQWAEEKSSASQWAEVRLFDADDIAVWLESAPTVSFWFASKLGRVVDGVQTLGEFARLWEARTEPSVPATTATAGRRPEVDKLLSWLGRTTTGHLAVAALNTDEAVVFVASAIESQELWW